HARDKVGNEVGRITPPPNQYPGRPVAYGPAPQIRNTAAGAGRPPKQLEPAHGIVEAMQGPASPLGVHSVISKYQKRPNMMRGQLSRPSSTTASGHRS